jgi:flagellar hook assembly protein FlgD
MTVELRHPGVVTLRVYDAAGRRVRELAFGPLPAGGHALAWDGRGSEGRSIASGPYYVVLEGEGVRFSRSLVLLR